LEVSDLAGNKANATWSFKISQKICINISLHKGWNMISLPLVNATLIVPFSVLQYAFWYDPENHSYQMVSIYDMQPGKGYWVFATDNCNITACGEPLLNYSIELKKGWNMIGAPALPADFSNPQTDPPNSVSPYAFWYNPENNSYELTQTLEPTKGYWVFALRDCKLYVTS